jgi:hypothetical protein
MCNLLRGYPENPAQHQREKPEGINAAHLLILLSNNQLIFGYRPLHNAAQGNGVHHVETGSDLRSRQH